MATTYGTSLDAFQESPPYDFWESRAAERVESGVSDNSSLRITRSVGAEHYKRGHAVSDLLTADYFDLRGFPFGELQHILIGSSDGYDVPMPVNWRTYLKVTNRAECKPDWGAWVNPVSSNNYRSEYVDGKIRDAEVDYFIEGSGVLPSFSELTTLFTLVSKNWNGTDYTAEYSYFDAGSGIKFIYRVSTSLSREYKEANLIADFVELCSLIPDIDSITRGAFPNYVWRNGVIAIADVADVMTLDTVNNRTDWRMDPRDADGIWFGGTASGGACVSGSYANNAPSRPGPLSNYRSVSCEFLLKNLGDIVAYVRESDSENNTVNVNGFFLPVGQYYYTYISRPLSNKQYTITFRSDHPPGFTL